MLSPRQMPLPTQITLEASKGSNALTFSSAFLASRAKNATKVFLREHHSAAQNDREEAAQYFEKRRETH